MPCAGMCTMTTLLSTWQVWASAMGTGAGMCVWCVRGWSTRLGRRARAVCVRRESTRLGRRARAVCVRRESTGTRRRTLARRVLRTVRNARLFSDRVGGHWIARARVVDWRVGAYPPSKQCTAGYYGDDADGGACVLCCCGRCGWRWCCAFGERARAGGPLEGQ